MKNFKSLLLYLSLFATSSTVISQQLLENSLYSFNVLNYNPAYAGSRDALSLSLVHRVQWTGIDGAPQSTFLTVHSPTTNHNLSWGLSAIREELGVTNVTGGLLNLSYRIQLNEKRDYLAFGIRGTMNMFDINISKLTALDPDFVLNNDINNELKFNVGAGIYYYGFNYFVGFSALNLLENSILDDAGDNVPGFKTSRHYYFTAGYVFELSSTTKLRPYAKLKVAPGAPLGPEVHCDLLFFDKLWLGGMYRYEDVAGLKAIYHVNDQFRIGYGYDYVFNELTHYTGGSHEVLLTYDFDFSDRKFKSPRYF